VTTAHNIKSSISVFTSRSWVTGLNNGYSFTLFSLSVSWQRMLTEELQQSHSRYHCTTAHIKSSNHTLSRHRLTSNSSSTNFQWLYPTENWTELFLQTVAARITHHRKHSSPTVVEACYHAIAQQSRRGPHRKHLSFLSRIIIAACLQLRCLAMDRYITIYHSVMLNVNHEVFWDWHTTWSTHTNKLRRYDTPLYRTPSSGSKHTFSNEWAISFERRRQQHLSFIARYFSVYTERLTFGFHGNLILIQLLYRANFSRTFITNSTYKFCQVIYVCAEAELSNY
jgi:hypothetical protein